MTLFFKALMVLFFLGQITCENILAGIQDTLSAPSGNKWKSEFGLSFSLMTSRRITDSNSLFIAGQTLVSYTSRYEYVTPGIAFNWMLGNKFLRIKNELALVLFRTNEKYHVTGVHTMFPFNTYSIWADLSEHRFYSLTYKLGAGLQWNRFCLIPQFQLNSVFYYRFIFIGGNEAIQQATSSSYGGFTFFFIPGLSLELNINVGKMWSFGISGFQNIRIRNDDYELASFQVSFIRSVFSN